MSDGLSATARRVLTYAVSATALLAAVGYAHYTSERDGRQREAEQRLGTLAELEARQLSAWRRERIADATLHTEALLIVGHFRDVLEGTDPELLPDTADWLEEIRESYGYTSAHLVDAEGRSVVASAGGPDAPSPAARALARRAMAKGRVVTGLAAGPGAGSATGPGADRVAFLVASAFPADDGVAGGTARGALVLQTGLESPLPETEPSAFSPGGTLEAFLLRREGDEVVFLTSLQRGAALPSRLPASTPGLVEAAASAAHAPRVVTGRDRADEPVLAAARPVPGTDWVALAKIDRSEIVGPALREAVLFALSIGAVVLVAGLLAALFSARSRHERRLANERERHRRREVELRSAYLSQFAPDAILLIDEGANLLDANERALEMFGRERGDLIGRHASETLAEPDRSHFAGIRRRALAGETVETRIVRADGSVLPVEATTRPIHFEGARYLVAVVRDTSERRAAAAAIDAANRRFRAVFENANDAILLVDGARIVECNERAADLLGRPRRDLLLHGLAGSDLDADLCRRARDAVDRRAGGAVVFGQRLTSEDGAAREVEVSVSHLYLDDRDLTLVMARDVSERRRLEQREQQAQRMEALGQLGGLIAHDFNNLLTAIVGHSEILEAELPRSEPSHREMLAEIRHSAELGASLTRKLLAFSRTQEQHPRVLDVNDVIRSMEPLLRPLMGESVSLEQRLADEPLRVRIDRGQLEQILVNLAVNARDAMSGSGVLTFHTSALPGRPGAGGDAGPRVRIRVGDTGEGMSEAVRSRALEPFFTTKEPGRGTGLGLASVYGIVRQSSGDLTLRSASGRGTTVEILLPRTYEASPDEPAAPERVCGGSETLLLVEDSAPVRRVTAAALEAAGYRVVVTTAPDEAIRLVEKELERIDLVITDVVMPGMSGIELVRRLRGLRPDLRVLYISGYAPEEILARGADDEPVDLVPKPFTPALLNERVRRALDRT